MQPSVINNIDTISISFSRCTAHKRFVGFIVRHLSCKFPSFLLNRATFARFPIVAWPCWRRSSRRRTPPWCRFRFFNQYNLNICDKPNFGFTFILLQMEGGRSSPSSRIGGRTSPGGLSSMSTMSSMSRTTIRTPAPPPKVGSSPALHPMPACCTVFSGVAHCAAPLPPNDAHLSVDLRLEAAARQGVGTESVAAQKKPKSSFHKWGLAIPSGGYQQIEF